MSEPREGVIKFEMRHTDGPLPRAAQAVTAELAAWRDILARLGGIGQDPSRYDGAGYGNVSARTGPFPGARGARAFVVTGTRTGGDRCVGPTRFCWVQRYDPGRNAVESVGPIAPSSESMTHGAIYDLGAWIRVVLHVHSPLVWRRRVALRLPTTATGVDYGTPMMAREMARLARGGSLLERRVLAMAGHEDGIVAFGRTAQAAGAALLDVLAAAGALAYRDDGRLCLP